MRDEDQNGGQLVVDGSGGAGGGRPDNRPESLRIPALPKPALLGRASLSVLLLSGAAFVLLHLLEAGRQAPAWASSHGDDLLSLPLVLGLALILQRLVRNDRSFRLPLAQGLATLAFFGLYFEFLAPRLLGRGTADLWDLAWYAVGWVVFQVGVNR